MTDPESIATDRLVLRRWRAEDEQPMAAINSDPEVTRLLNRRLDPAGVAGFFGVITQHWQEHGFGPWAVEAVDGEFAGQFLGFAGLAVLPPFLASAATVPELGWRLRSDAWGRGFATEAAVAARDHALTALGFDHVVSIIHPENVRSQRVAVKLGMSHERDVDNPVLGRTVELWTTTR